MRALVLSAFLLFGGCDTETEEVADTDTCSVPCQWSTAASGDMCQANLYCDGDDFAVYCGETADGGYTCNCGPAAENPPSFESPDFCDLEDEDRLCEAIARCDNWDF